MEKEKSIQIKGIDISHYQKQVDWKKVKNSGIQFAMIKATEGKSYIDSCFEKNVVGARAAGIETGAYHFFRAYTQEDTCKEAEHFLNVIKGMDLTYPVVLDVEADELLKKTQSKDILTKLVITFLNKLEEQKYYAMVYANRNWFTNNLDDKKLSNYDHWLAEYSSSPKYADAIGMWQYSDKGTVCGINGNVDLDIAYKDYAKIIRGMKK